MNQILVTGDINRKNKPNENSIDNKDKILSNNDAQKNNLVNNSVIENDSFNNTNSIVNTNLINENSSSFNENTTYNNYNGSTETKKDIKSVAKIIAFIMIVFGIIMIGDAIFNIIKTNKENALKVKPETTINRYGNVLEISIKSDVALRSVGYAWNNDEMHYVSAKEENEFTISINVMDGENNKLNISVVDMSNNKTSFKGKFSKEPDTTKPKITVSNEDPKVKITVTDDTALDHVIYKFGDGDEEIVYADSDDPTTIEIYLDEIDTTQKTLVVEAVDSSQNTTEETTQIKGTTKPVIKFEKASDDDPSILKITISCEDNLQKIVIYLGENRYSTPENVSIDKKEFVQKVKVESGTTIKVNAYNVSEQMTEKTITYEY